jgi:hypothetical protein
VYPATPPPGSLDGDQLRSISVGPLAVAATPAGMLGGVVSADPAFRLRLSTSKLWPEAAFACWKIRSAIESPVATEV